MSNYTKTTNFGAKDTLPSGDSQKIIRGTEFDTEFNNVATAIATKLEVDGSNNLAISGTFSSTKLIPTGGTATGNGMYLPAANTLALSTNGTERVRVDSSGNLGVGTTVGAASGTGLIIYSPTSTRLQLRNSTTGDTAGDGCGLLAFGSDLYVENRENGATLFFNNGSERARIDSSGNLGIGTATPGAKLDVDGGIRAAVGSATLAAIGAGDLTINASNAAGQIAFRTAGSERARIDSAGNLTVGQSISTATLADAGYLSIKNTANTSGFDIGLLGGSSDINAFIYQRANGYLAFGTNNAERARIDSSGNFSVGTTTTPTQITFAGSSGITYQRSTDNSFSGVLDYLKSRGSAASPTVVQNGDGLFTLRIAPYHGSAYTYLTSQVVEVDGTFTSGQNPPTRIAWYTNAANGSSSERARIKSTGQFRFVPLSADPSGAESGDVYYNSTSNKLKVYNGTSWVDLH